MSVSIEKSNRTVALLRSVTLEAGGERTIPRRRHIEADEATHFPAHQQGCTQMQAPVDGGVPAKEPAGGSA
ncbi:hypothetical protein AAGT00_32875 [Streptomyces cavourensis]